MTNNNYELPGYLVPVWVIYNGKLSFLDPGFVQHIDQARYLLLKDFPKYRRNQYLEPIPNWLDAAMYPVTGNPIVVLGTILKSGALILQVWEINSKNTTYEGNNADTQSLRMIYEEVITQGMPITDYTHNTLQSLYTLTAPHLKLLSLSYKYGAIL